MSIVKMKVVKITSLREGDWVIFKPEAYLDKKGKFEIAKVKEFRIELDKVIKIDMDKKTSKEVKDYYTGFEGDKQRIWKINKKELDEIKFINKKIKIIENLDEE